MGMSGAWRVNDRSGPASRTARSVKWILLLAGVAALLALGTCGWDGFRQYRKVDTAVAGFHRQLDQAEYEDIYGDATDQFRIVGTRPHSIAFFQRVHDTMGASGKSSIRGFNIHVSTQGRFVDATFATQFARGQATEVFVWRMDPDQPRLWNYRIDAPSLR